MRDMGSDLPCHRTVRRVLLLLCRYTCTSQWAKARTTLKGKSLPACVLPTAYANGSALVFYNSTSYRDDIVWAAAWMYKATGEKVRDPVPCSAPPMRSQALVQYNWDSSLRQRHSTVAHAVIAGNSDELVSS